ncbi:MAG TPA: RsmE family RNA methyltransferase, partial [Luteolibacter sp.]|nr:RsmE family RNA methyltransferase [Luteolibacter sp.]
SEPVLSGDEARHLSQVLRIRPGETINVFDGAGKRASAMVLSVSRDHVPLEIGETSSPDKSGPRIVLAQAIPKGKNMDLIVQKGVELGVSGIVPLVTKNTVVQPGEGKSDKWRRNALEACKQCGQDTLPEITEPLSFNAWLEREAALPGLKLLASLHPGAVPFRQTLRENPQPERVVIAVGPEGDLTREEADAAVAKGFIPVTLGDIILRVETASLFCVSAVRYEYS